MTVYAAGALLWCIASLEPTHSLRLSSRMVIPGHDVEIDEVENLTEDRVSVSSLPDSESKFVAAARRYESILLDDDADWKNFRDKHVFDKMPRRASKQRPATPEVSSSSSDASSDAASDAGESACASCEDAQQTQSQARHRRAMLRGFADDAATLAAGAPTHKSTRHANESVQAAEAETETTAQQFKDAGEAFIDFSMKVGKWWDSIVHSSGQSSQEKENPSGRVEAGVPGERFAQPQADEAAKKVGRKLFALMLAEKWAAAQKAEAEAKTYVKPNALMRVQKLAAETKADSELEAIVKSAAEKWADAIAEGDLYY